MKKDINIWLNHMSSIAWPAILLWILLLFLPTLFILLGFFKDTEKTWLYFDFLIPIINIVILILFIVKSSKDTAKKNEYENYNIVALSSVMWFIWIYILILLFQFFIFNTNIKDLVSKNWYFIWYIVLFIIYFLLTKSILKKIETNKENTILKKETYKPSIEEIPNVLFETHTSMYLQWKNEISKEEYQKVLLEEKNNIDNILKNEELWEDEKIAISKWIKQIKDFIDNEINN